MRPFLFDVDGTFGTIHIPSYGLLVLLGFVFAFLLVNSRLRKVGIEADRIYPIYVIAAVSGMIGGRFLYTLATIPDRFFQNPIAALAESGGIAVYGGVIGGLIAVLAALHFMKLPVWKITDIFAPALALGMGIGRFGCFFAGCCHGGPIPSGDDLHPLLSPGGFLNGQIYTLPHFPFIALEFFGGMSRFLDQPLYPTQLWSAFLSLSLCLLLVWGWSKRRFDGQITAIFLMLEPIGRIVVESFRADERGYAVSFPLSSAPTFIPAGMTQAGKNGEFLVGITTSQFLGLGLMAFGLFIFIRQRKKGIATETPLTDD